MHYPTTGEKTEYGICLDSFVNPFEGIKVLMKDKGKSRPYTVVVGGGWEQDEQGVWHPVGVDNEHFSSANLTTAAKWALL